jgi:uncharacterized protein (DUF305 family)
MMTTKSFTIKLSLLTVLLLLSRFCLAQSMPMTHNQGHPTKNIFLQLMDTMMLRMDGAPGGRTCEAEFLLQMIPHHEGAVAMAEYEIRHGKNGEMVQLAKSIAIEQRSEIQQMRLWLQQSPAAFRPVDTAYRAAMKQTMATMMDNLPALDAATDTDRVFALVMIPHHQAAIDMAKVLLHVTTDKSLAGYLHHLIASEQVEIDQMRSFLNN